MRKAASQDVDAVARLLAAFRDWWGKDVPPEGELRRVVAVLIGDPQTDFLLAGDPPVGVCQLRYRLSVWTGTHDCWLEDLFVAGAARGSGVGAALLDAAIATAKTRGCRRIELDVNEQNDVAIALYTRAGFTVTPKPPGRTLLVSRSL